jgi:hypothetical protein
MVEAERAFVDERVKKIIELKNKVFLFFSFFERRKYEFFFLKMFIFRFAIRKTKAL